MSSLHKHSAFAEYISIHNIKNSVNAVFRKNLRAKYQKFLVSKYASVKNQPIGGGNTSHYG